MERKGRKIIIIREERIIFTGRIILHYPSQRELQTKHSLKEENNLYFILHIVTDHQKK